MKGMVSDVGIAKYDSLIQHVVFNITKALVIIGETNFNDV